MIAVQTPLANDSRPPEVASEGRHYPPGFLERKQRQGQLTQLSPRAHAGIGRGQSLTVVSTGSFATRNRLVGEAAKQITRSGCHVRGTGVLSGGGY